MNGLRWQPLAFQLVIGSALSGACSAEEAGETPAPQHLPSEGWVNSTGDWLESTRDSWSEAISFSAEGIDNYLRREDDTEPAINDSYVKIQLRERFEKSGQHNFEATIKAKLRLPHTRRRFRVTFDSDPDDFDSLSQRRRDQVGGVNSTQEARDKSVIGIGVDDEVGRNWKSNYNVGMQIKLPLNPFYRAQFYRAFELSPLWSSKLKQSFSYFHMDGWQAESTVNFYRPISKKLMFQAGSAAQFIDQTNNWEVLQSLSLHQRLSRDSAFEHQVGVSGDSRPELKSSSFWVRTELRHRLYKDWLYGKVAPELFFQRSNSFRMEPILLFELEVYFGKSPDVI